MESSISSTPARGFAAKTGGTERVRAALTTRNSESSGWDSFSFFVGWVDCWLWRLSFRFEGMVVRDKVKKRDWSRVPHFQVRTHSSSPSPAPHHGRHLRLYSYCSILTCSPSRRQKPLCKYSSQAPGYWARLSSKLADRPSKVRVPHISAQPPNLIFYTDAKASPAGAMGNDASGIGNANTGSPTDQLTRSHRMTVDEANLILNAKKGDSIEQIFKVRIINFS